ncbi:hypothetical protein [Methanovulcanius yangii]|uniref:hypothetical protein n=1 Tax=Methanovulcanius yangii TaxID=1789227 RepID=UPI0029CA29BB|nr:hypothetical protein [Methanovulcanius yangii]
MKREGEEAKRNIAEAISLHLEPLDAKESSEDRSRTKGRFLEEMTAIEAERDFVEFIP